MQIGIICLVAAYVLSQFYRAFLAVLAPLLGSEIGAGPDTLSVASGVWFLTFAAMQIPVGWALDTHGPRRTATVLFLIGAAGGAAIFALAQVPWHITLAMGLIGIGCSPVLMASFYIFTRSYSPAVFATMAGLVIGTGSLGNIAGAAPLAWAVEAMGWRETMWALVAISVVISVALWLTIRDPERVDASAGGSVLDLLKIRALWLILPMMFVNYAPAAGIRGLWVGPYAEDVFGASTAMIGNVTLVMALAMVVGNFAYGPMDRLTGSRKWVVFVGNALGAVACFALWFAPSSGLWVSAALLAAVGFFGASFPVLMAHGRSLFPPHLAGRGVTLMNLFGIGGVGLMQVVSGRLHGAAEASGAPPGAVYGTLFGFYGVLLVAGLAVYLFSADRRD